MFKEGDPVILLKEFTDEYSPWYTEGEVDLEAGTLMVVSRVFGGSVNVAEQGMCPTFNLDNEFFRPAVEGEDYTLRKKR